VAQTQETVNLLYKIRVMWGDRKPDNILIYEVTDNA
jgi:hypothetical protein